MTSGPLDIERLRQHLAAETIGQQIEIHDEVDSTNSLALRRAGDPSSHGLVILAESQTAGRGRFNRIWQSPKGASILCSVLLILKEGDPRSRGLWLWTPLAIREAIETSCHLACEIKWPNDLLSRDRKLCGILIESTPLSEDRRAWVIGIGLNCLQHARHFPPELLDSATSLDLELPQPIDRLTVARALIQSLDTWFQRSAHLDPQELKSRWQEHALPLGKRLVLNSEGRQFTGSLIDLDPEAGILVQLDTGGRRLFSPHVTSIERLD